MPHVLAHPNTAPPAPATGDAPVDAYFSADVETDGPIPGEYSMLSFALVFAGTFDGVTYIRPNQMDRTFLRELRPISRKFQVEALQVNGLDRRRLRRSGTRPEVAMREAAQWVTALGGNAKPVLVAYPLSFDWAWLYWYFIKFLGESPFSYSRCFDLKTAVAVKRGVPIAQAGRDRLPDFLRSPSRHTHQAMDDAIEQAEIFANVFQWNGRG